MRILQVISTWKGGAVRVAFDITRKLSHRGHEVIVYATDLVQETKDLEGMIDNIHRMGLLCPSLAKRVKFYITPDVVLLAKNVKYFDIVHLHEYRTFQNIIIHHYAMKYNVPYLLQAHGSLPRSFARRELKWIYDVFFGHRLLKDASKVIALNQVEAEQYRGMGVPEEKIEIIPNGIDLSEYSNLPPKGFFKKKFGIDEDDKIILYLGRIHKIKGIDVLVEAFADVIKRLDAVKLVIVGPDDGYLGELENLIKALNLEDNVLVAGPLYGKSKLEAYVDAYVYVLPSRYEMFPISVLEAVACKTPVILTDKCGIAECCREKVCQVVKSDSNHLSEALLEMLTNREKQMIFRENCKTMMEKSNISETVSKLEEVYEKVSVNP